MSPADVQITFVDADEMTLQLVQTPDVVIDASASLGPQGPPGPVGPWMSLTQAEYDALDPPDPDVLYVIIA
jgi:hypothetical protein